MVSPSAQVRPGTSSVSYPPKLTGMRDNHPGSFEAAHALAWRGTKPTRYRKLTEHYDLVIVGAGLSGLAAARFYQKHMGASARILLLDNHDDFGGHAKRNEFHESGRMLLGVGGSVNLESPEDYSEVAKGLLDELGIDFEAMKTNIGDFAISSSDTGSVLALPGTGGHVSVVGH
jgi:spermidine dehydrogenase